MVRSGLLHVNVAPWDGLLRVHVTTPTVPCIQRVQMVSRPWVDPKIMREQVAKESRYHIKSWLMTPKLMIKEGLVPTDQSKSA